MVRKNSKVFATSCRHEQCWNLPTEIMDFQLHNVPMVFIRTSFESHYFTDIVTKWRIGQRVVSPGGTD